MNNLQKNSILELDGKIFKKIKFKKKNLFDHFYFQNGIFSYLTLKSKVKVKRTVFLCATLRHIMMHIGAKYKGTGT
jgi:aspartate/tyrosine/aromatic aminotransferase